MAREKDGGGRLDFSEGAEETSAEETSTEVTRYATVVQHSTVPGPFESSGIQSQKQLSLALAESQGM